MKALNEAEDPAGCLANGLHQTNFQRFVVDNISILDPTQLKEVVTRVPKQLLAVVFQVPPGVICGMKTLPGPKRLAMYMKLNGIYMAMIEVLSRIHEPSRQLNIVCMQHLSLRCLLPLRKRRACSHYEEEPSPIAA